MQVVSNSLKRNKKARIGRDEHKRLILGRLQNNKITMGKLRREGCYVELPRTILKPLYKICEHPFGS
jgi:hypothetical protein